MSRRVRCCKMVAKSSSCVWCAAQEMVEVRPKQHFLGKKDTFSCLAISLDGILEYTEVWHLPS